MNVRPAREDELAAVGRLISYSFDQFTANAFLTPDPARRLDVNAEYVTLLTEHARPHGRVDVIDDGYGPELADAALYKRHGYTEMKPFDSPLPDDTRFFRMWRSTGLPGVNSAIRRYRHTVPEYHNVHETRRQYGVAVVPNGRPERADNTGHRAVSTQMNAANEQSQDPPLNTL